MMDAAIRELLERTRRIAVLGASSNPARDSHRVFVYLVEAGFDCVPVNPRESEVAGRPAVADLAAAGPVDLVDVFRAPEHVPDIVDELIELDLKALWLQLGVDHPEAVRQAREAGIQVVRNRCLMVEHRRLQQAG